MSDALFPLFLKLNGRRVLVVGGGRVAAGKLPALLAAGAQVAVVAPEVRPEFEAAEVEIWRRSFEPWDVDGAWLVVAAAPPEVNRAVVAAASAQRIFVNAVDDVASASAYTAGVLRRGGLTIAVATEGRAPALAGLVREGLEAVLPDEIESWVTEARRVRERQRLAGVPFQQRRPLLLEALNRLYTDRVGATS
ncbi:MAG TPA: bifunctional precorrin-2 dehydrogenase/sirohydrochlorin ferrochelatase [Vicinamibacteria bacterium]|nr:bifunctional precorrin-2 dehydrogenase/sirohydrochlorin ferrochelatase [Vicinamibacteria bacterium]